MPRNHRVVSALAPLALASLIAACGQACAPGGRIISDGDADVDSDSDVDGDSDADAEGGTDGDAEGDGSTCGDGTCGEGEDGASCPEDCPVSCGDTYCDETEDASSCPSDCPARCGDGACTHDERAVLCPEDCPPVCGDGACTHDERQEGCAVDCTVACGDGSCSGSESASTCPSDCPASCGDGECTHGESARSCEEDCPAVCGDGECTHDEDPASCAEDCPISCGDLTCTSDESALTCPDDCPALCGDGLCTHDEAASGCPGDCPAVCGDRACTHAESASSCPADCPASCGDRACTTPETAATCPGDCPASCGDRACTHTESASSCPADCPAFCGDRACTHTESASSCPADCPALCPDGACTHTESASSCPADCPALCGDRACTHGETPATCPGDCPALCGDFACTSGETASSCPGDCGCAAAGACGGPAPSGCGCDNACPGRDDCCPDACAVCGACACVVAGDLTSTLGGASTFGSNATGRNAVDGCGEGESEEAVYTVTPPFSGSLTVSLVNPGTSFDTVLSVRDGSCGGVEVACNDDFSGLDSQVTFPVTSGRTYFVVVEGYAGATGAFELTAHRRGVCEGLAPAVAGTALIGNGTTTLATSSSVSSLSGLCSPGSAPDGLVTFTAPRTGTIVASTNFAGTTFDTVLYAREAECDSQGRELDCNDDDDQPAFGSSLRSEVELDVVAGRSYSLLVDGFSSASGTAQVGLGYGGTRPVRGALGACGGAATDIYRVFVAAGDRLHVRADTVAPATAGDLCVFVYDTNGTTFLAGYGDFDDYYGVDLECTCTYAPPRYCCPDGTIVSMPTTGFAYVHVTTCSEYCADLSNAEYSLAVERDGVPARLMGTRDQ